METTVNKTHFAPELLIPNETANMDFYIQLGATELFCFRNDDGSIHVSALEIDGAVFHLQETMPWFNAIDPMDAKGVSCVIGLFVPHVDEAMQKAIQAGAH